MRVNKKKRQAYRPSDHVVSRESAVSSILGAIGIFGYLILEEKELIDSTENIIKKVL